jgi:hypothetical protein
MAGTKTTKIAEAIYTHPDNVEEFPGASGNPATVTLPTGAATAANQATQITAEQAVATVAGAVDDAAVTTDADGTLSAKLRGLIVQGVTILSNLASLVALIANSAFTVLLKSPALYELEDGRSTDHSGVPSGTDGVAVPAWAHKAVFTLIMLTGGGASTVPITLYGRTKKAGGTGQWKPIPGAVVANLDSETDDTLGIVIDDVDMYDYVACYTNGSAGTFTYDAEVSFSQA